LVGGRRVASRVVEVDAQQEAHELDRRRGAPLEAARVLRREHAARGAKANLGGAVVCVVPLRPRRHPREEHVDVVVEDLGPLRGDVHFEPPHRADARSMRRQAEPIEERRDLLGGKRRAAADILRHSAAARHLLPTAGKFVFESLECHDVCAPVSPS
jgi:hypothetical protein